jgi:hypothetical protein
MGCIYNGELEPLLYAHIAWSESNLTLFVPGVFHVDMTGGAQIGRTPQKFCRLTAIIL